MFVSAATKYYFYDRLITLVRGYLAALDPAGHKWVIMNKASFHNFYIKDTTCNRNAVERVWCMAKMH